MWAFAALLATVLCAQAQNFPTVITTVAGGGPPENVPATSTYITPAGVALDGAGNLFIGDPSTERVRKVDHTALTMSTVAGNGFVSFSGDGGPAISAALHHPSGIVVDSAGNVFFSDQFNFRVRRVDLSGNISTVVGGGSSPSTCAGSTDSVGDGCLATQAVLDPISLALDLNGNLIIADGFSRIRRVDHTTQIISTIAGTGTSSFSGDGGPATSANISFPEGVAVDASGNIFIADTGNERVRKVDLSGNINTVAGNGTFGFSGDGGLATAAQLAFPTGVAVDGAGNLYINDIDNNRIRKVNAGGTISTVAGNGKTGYFGDDGPATAAGLTLPQGIAVDASGNVFIADNGNHAIRRVSNGFISTVAGDGDTEGDGGPAVTASMHEPVSVSIDAGGNLFVPVFIDSTVRKIAPDGIITNVAGNYSIGFFGDGGLATHAGLTEPQGAATDSDGNLFIADSSAARIRRVDHLTQVITTVAGNGTSTFAGDGGAATSASLNLPTNVVPDNAGNLFITDSNNHRIRKVDSSGIITTVAGTGAAIFSGDNMLASASGLSFPDAVALDGAGNLFIADAGNHRVRRVDHATQLITTVAGNGVGTFAGDGGPATAASLNGPSWVALDAAGNLFICDQNNNRIRKVDTHGIITTIAGTGTVGFSGDGGPATAATFNFPNGVAVDGLGNVFIDDLFNYRIRKVVTFPVANGQTLTTPQGIPLAITLTGASPRGAVPLTFSIAGKPAHGTLSGFSPATGTVTYTPASGFSGADSFTFTVNDGNVDSASQTISITVTPAPPPPPPDFTVGSNPSSASIKAGQSATFTLTVTPQNGYSNQISFACSGLPALTTCTFTPPTVTPSGSAINVTLVVKTTGPNAVLGAPPAPNRQKQQPLYAFWTISQSWGILGGAIGLILAGAGEGKRRSKSGLAMIVGLVVMLVLLVSLGCGGSTTQPATSPATPPGASTITVTASGTGGATHAANVTVTVTQ